MLTTLGHESDTESSTLEVSSLIDTWLLVRNVESDGERNRLLFVIKSRGAEHSNQVREFVLTADGPHLVDVSVGPAGVVTGSARLSLQAQQEKVAARREQDIEARPAALARRAAEVDAHVAVLRAQLDEEAAALDWLIAQESRQEDLNATAHSQLLEARGDGSPAQPDDKE